MTEIEKSLNEVFEKIKLNSINIEFDNDNSRKLSIGTSKLGGKPDLPKNFEWYYFTGESQLTDEVANRPLSFLAQINCEEAKQYDIDSRLPKKGMLYFFYELESMVWGFDPKDKGCAKAFYFNGDMSDLKRTDFPPDMQEEYKLPELKMNFFSKYNVPNFEEYDKNDNNDLWEEYDNFKEEMGYVQEEISTKLLGYSDNIQGDMLLDCELVANGLYCGDSTGYESPEIKHHKKNSNRWKLLFQLDSVEKDDFELMFGDSGRIYFFIKEDDLKNSNFENVWLILQCY
ncbi:MAG: YwqG family protein [Bacillota bacterium]|jgi:uncharacterized protein YwqG